MEQRSPEWFNARKGKLTGSNIGAALGVNPWKTPDALIRQMVREWHGAESEFTGSIATEYGTLHEPLALMDYQTKTGHFVTECGFFVHPRFDWLGASPDGLVDEDGLVEVKCPFGQRDKNPPEFKSIHDQQHYFAQVQIELFCTGRQWCDFYSWSQYGDDIERVYIDPHWIDDNMPALEAFYKWFLAELNNPEHLEPLAKIIDNIAAYELLKEYDQNKTAIGNAEARNKEIMQELTTLAKGRNAVIHGRRLTLVERAGSISYAAAIKDLAPDADLSKYQGKPTTYWKLS
jgi:putative phage-type endonuclease